MTFFSQFPDLLLNVVLSKLEVKDLFLIESNVDEQKFDIEFEYKSNRKVVEAKISSNSGVQNLEIMIKPRFFSFIHVLFFLYGTEPTTTTQSTQSEDNFLSKRAL